MISPLPESTRNYAILAACPISLALMGYGVKMADHLPVAVVLLARFGLSALGFTIILFIQRFNFSEIRPLKHIGRTALGFASVACLFAAISRIPLSTAICLSYTVPIFTYVFSVLFQNKKLDIRGLFVISAIFGVAMILQPSAKVELIGALLGLASAFFGALALFEIKRISKTESTQSILLMYFLYSTIALIVYLLLFETLNPQLVLNDGYLALIAVGLFGFLYQYTLVGSLSRIPVPTVSLFLLIAVIVGYGIDASILGADITASAIIGTLVLTVSLFFYQRSENLQSLRTQRGMRSVKFDLNKNTSS